MDNKKGCKTYRYWKVNFGEKIRELEFVVLHAIQFTMQTLSRQMEMQSCCEERT